MWVNRSGETVARVLAPPGSYGLPRLSPDEQYIALRTAEGRERLRYIKVLDVRRGVFLNITLEPGSVAGPVWSPDGTQLVFAIDKKGMDALYVVNLESRDEAKELFPSHASHWPSSWSKDNRLLLIEMHPDTLEDIWIYDFNEESDPKPLINTPYREYNPMFSPNGSWIAYVSTESGQPEVYLWSLDESRLKTPVSRDGGAEPMWSRDGRELFYRNGDVMMSVKIDYSSENIVGEPEPLFERKSGGAWSHSSRYDLDPHGQRFLMIEGTDDSAELTRLAVVTNWLEEVKQKKYAPLQE